MNYQTDPVSLKNYILLENYWKLVTGKYSVKTYYDNIYRTVEEFGNDTA